jgi:serine/threonine protein kinase
MEFVEGVSLIRYCDDRGLGIPERVRLLCSVCDAVQFAHQNLVIHRDLKPSNVLVTPGVNRSCWTSASPSCSIPVTRTASRTRR